MASAKGTEGAPIPLSGCSPAPAGRPPGPGQIEVLGGDATASTAVWKASDPLHGEGGVEDWEHARGCVHDAWTQYSAASAAVTGRLAEHDRQFMAGFEAKKPLEVAFQVAARRALGTDT
ncbi:hypothetical protein GCM10009837_48380 [Streptomyces durmitorensis]